MKPDGRCLIYDSSLATLHHELQWFLDQNVTKERMKGEWVWVGEVKVKKMASFAQYSFLSFIVAFVDQF